MKELLKTLNSKANNLEEICCGTGFHWEWFENKEKRDDLIDQIEEQLEPFIEALKKLKNNPLNNGMNFPTPSEKEVSRRAFLHYKSLADHLSKRQLAEHCFITGVNYWHHQLTGEELELE